MPVQPNYNLFRPVDIGGAFQQGMEQGKKDRRERIVRNAFAEYATDPTSDAPVRALFSVDPALGFRLQGKQRADAAYEKEQAFTNALGAYYQSQRGVAGNPLAAAAGALPEQPAPPISLPSPPTVADAAQIETLRQGFGGDEQKLQDYMTRNNISVGGPAQIDARMVDNMDPSTYQDALQSFDTINQLIDAADTPRKWNKTIDQLAEQAPDFAQYRGQFKQRDALRAQIEQGVGMIQERMAAAQQPPAVPTLADLGVEMNSQGQAVATGNTGPAANMIDGSAAVEGDPKLARDAQRMGVAPEQLTTADVIQSRLGSEQARQRGELDELYAIDPIRAREIDIAEQEQGFATVERELETIKAADEAYDIAISTLPNVTDDASYQVALDRINARLTPFGVDVRQDAPATYPGREGIAELIRNSMSAKEQVAARDRQLRLENDIADDAADNARADRNTASLIADRGQRTAISRQREGRISRGRSKGGKKPTRTAKAGEPVAVDANGNKRAYNGKKWVPVK